MASRRDKRIEPSFEGPSQAAPTDGFSVREEDRVVPASRKTSAKRKTTRAAAKGGRGRRARRCGLLGLFTRAVYWCFVLAIWGGIAAAGVAVYYGAKMPAATTWSIPERAPNIKIVSVDGHLIANRGMSGGEAISLKQMSPYIPEAVVAIEDRRFYSHFGVDPIGLARAMLTNLTGGRFSQGGSTITQQLARNIFLNNSRTFDRKIREAILSLLLPVFLLGAIVTGLTTATEAGVIGVVYAFILGGFVYKDYPLRDFFRIFVDSAINTAIPVFVLSATSVAAWIVAVEQFPQELVGFFQDMEFGRIMVLLTINVFLLFVGMVMDLVPALILFAPILLPVAQAVGVDPIQFGVIMVMNLGVGLVTPPVGNCLYLGAVIAKVDLLALARASLPFLVVNLITLLLVTYLPQISLFLPSLFY